MPQTIDDSLFTSEDYPESNRRKVADLILGLPSLQDEAEHFTSQKNPADMGKNNRQAQIRNGLRAITRHEIAELFGVKK